MIAVFPGMNVIRREKYQTNFCPGEKEGQEAESSEALPKATDFTVTGWQSVCLPYTGPEFNTST